MAERDLAVLHDVASLRIAHHAPVIRVVRERAAALHDEGEHRLPGWGIEVGERMRATDFLVERVRVEPAAERERHAMLREHVQRQARRQARLDAAVRERVARRGVLDQFERMRRHADHVRRFAGAVACAAGTLQQARHALRAAELQDLVDCGEVDAEVEARGRHHATHAAFAQAAFGGTAQAGVERTVVQRERALVFGPHGRQRAMPEFSLRARVGEQQAGALREQAVHDPRKLDQAEVAGPGKAFAGVRQQRLQRQRAGREPGDERGIPHMRQQDVACLFEVAERRGQAPGAHARRQRTHARERELQQDTALVAEQLVPFIHDDGAQAGELRGAVRVGQQQGERLGGRHQGIELAGPRQPLVARARIAGAQADAPVQPQRLDGRAQGAQRVGRQGAQRRDPQQAERPRGMLLARDLRGFRERIQQRSPERRQGLAAPRRRVQQSGFACQPPCPHFALEGQWRPALRIEPRQQSVVSARARIHCRLAGRGSPLSQG